jgi:type III secretion HrpO family protein
MPPRTDVGPEELVGHAREALLLIIALSLPVVGVAAVVGLVVAAFQAASQVQDATLAHLPRLVAVAGALVLLGPWMGIQVATFAERLFLLAH